MVDQPLLAATAIVQVPTLPATDGEIARPVFAAGAAVAEAADGVVADLGVADFVLEVVSAGFADEQSTLAMAREAQLEVCNDKNKKRLYTVRVRSDVRRIGSFCCVMQQTAKA